MALAIRCFHSCVPAMLESFVIKVCLRIREQNSDDEGYRSSLLIIIV